MSTLKPSDLFLMQRDDLVLSFNGSDFAELVLDAGSEQFDYLSDKIEALDNESNDFEIRITNNTNTIGLIVDAVNTLQKTSVTSQLSANPFSFSTSDLPQGEVLDIKHGHLYMTGLDGNGDEVDVYTFEDATKIYISSRNSQFLDINAEVVSNYEWENLEVHDPNDPASGDYIQVSNIRTEGVGLFLILGITPVTDSVNSNKGIIASVQYIKGNLNGSLVHQMNADGSLRTDYLNSQVVAQGIKTKVGLDINDADNRYLVKKDGGVVEEDTHFLKKLTVGQRIQNFVQVYHEPQPLNTIPRQGQPILQVWSTPDLSVPFDENTNGKLKFEVRSSGEIYSDPDYKPWEGHHIPNVSYIKSNFLTETGYNNTISANDRYLRRDGTNTMDSVITFTGTANNDIIRLNTLPSNLAVINAGANQLNVKFNSYSAYKMNIGDSSGKVEIVGGKVKLGTNHVNYTTSNYNQTSINNYVATIGVMKTAISNANIPTTGTGGTKGVVKLLDSVSSNLNVNQGTAATPLAVKTVNDKIYNGMRVAGFGSSSVACEKGGIKENNGHLYYRTL